MRLSIHMGYPSRLDDSLSSAGPEERTQVLRRLTAEFSEEGWISREAAAYAIHLLAYAKGYLEQFCVPEEPLEAEPGEKAKAADRWTPDLSGEDLKAVKENIRSHVAMFACGKLFLTSRDRDVAALGEEFVREAADKGNPEAQRLLGELYFARKEMPKSFAWYERAAVSGNPDAAYRLGCMYGMAGQYEEAAKWFRMAAQGGVAEAQLQYGILLEQGIGTRRDRQGALLWFRISAKAGNKKAEEAYRKLYEKLKI